MAGRSSHRPTAEDLERISRVVYELACSAAVLITAFHGHPIGP